MEKTLTRAERVLAGTVLSILVLFLASVGIRGVTGIMMKYFNIENMFTKIVFFDNPANEVRRGDRLITFDWRELYPFSSESQIRGTASKTPLSERLLIKFSALKRSAELFVTTDRLLGYTFFVGLAKRYEALVDWNFASMSEYNGVVKLADGYLAGYTVRKDVSESAQTTIDLANYCKDRDIDFLYVNAPAKVCRFEDANVSGVLDFVNQNADEFLQQISEAGVRYYDLRQALHDEGMSHHGAFFRTDHHWLPETGLWASRHILQVLRDDYGWPVDPSVLNADRFRTVKYPACFLGSLGRKVTLARTTPDDFSLLYPDYQTQVRLQIFKGGIDRIDITGDFADTYNISRLEEGDYDVYDWTYIYGGGTIVKMENLLLNSRKKVLLIRDSFSSCIIPFLNMGIKYIEALGLRAFNGSVHTYIESIKPDAVLVLLTASNIGNSQHFHFR